MVAVSAGFWLLVALAAAGLLMVVFTSGARTGRRVEKAATEAYGGSASLVRVLVTAVVIVAGQWLTTRLAAPPLVWVVVFGLPALLAGTAVARLLAVTDTVRSIGGRR